MTKATLLKKISSFQDEINELQTEINKLQDLMDNITEEQNDKINTAFTKFGATDTEIDKAVS